MGTLILYVQTQISLSGLLMLFSGAELQWRVESLQIAGIVRAFVTGVLQIVV